MSAPRRDADSRIRELFHLGNGVDAISERGLTAGWTRADVLRVANEAGILLAPNGRPRLVSVRPATAPYVPAPRQAPTDPVAVDPLWTALLEGRRHTSKTIRDRADRIHAQLTRLADTLSVDAEQARNRAALAEAQAKAQLANPTAGPTPITHGTRAGSQAHRRRNEPVCEPCLEAERQQTAEQRAKRRARREQAGQ